MTVALTKKGKAKTAIPKPQAARPKPAGKQALGDVWSGSGSFDSHTFTAMPIIQPKLKIGDPNDKYEQEADRVADEVMRMPDSEVMDAPSAQPPTGNSTPAIQRMCSDCAMAEETVQRKPHQATFQPPKISSLSSSYSPQFLEPNSATYLQRQEMEEEEEPLQMKQESNATPTITPGIEAGIQSLKGGGQPLSQSERAFFEPRFGYDFSQVRIHTNDDAINSAQALGASAFTTGQHVAFNAGKYSPETTSGKHLMAHELVHALQQSKYTKSKNKENLLIQRQCIATSNPIVEEKLRQKAIYINNITEPCLTCPDSLIDPSRPKHCERASVHASWKTLFQRLATDESKQKTYFIQEIEVIIDFSVPPSQEYSYEPHYWEAFEIDKNTGIAKDEDFWHLTFPDETKGEWEMTGKLFFSESLPPGMESGNVANAGSLPSTTTEPERLGRQLGERRFRAKFDFTGSTKLHHQ